MAVAVVKFKNGKKGMGTPHFDYIMRDGKYAPKADDLERLVISDSGNMPEWAMNDPKFYWSMADELERENGRIYKEHIIALPRGLDDQQLEQLARDLIKEHIGDKHPYSFAIHAPLATDGKEQPHLHFMYSERTLDGIERGADTFFKRYNSKNPSKGGCKKANLAMKKGEARQQAKELRQRIGDTINKHLELANRPERVDMRSKRDIEKAELEQAQAELSQELAELEQLDQVSDFTQDDLKDVLARLQLEQAEIVIVPEQPEPQPTVRLSLAEQRARNRAKKGQDELTPEQRVARAVTTAQHRQFDDDALRKLIETDTAKQATVSNEADQIKKQVDTLKTIVGIVTQQLYERYSQVQPSQLKTLAELHQTVIDGLDDMASREVIPDFDSKVVEYSDSKNNLATIDQVTGRLAQLKAERERLKQAVSTAPQPRPEPQQSIVRSDKGNAPQLTPTPTPRPRPPQPQAQSSERAKLQAKIAEMQNKRLQETIERNRELERELERLNQREQPQTPPDRELSDKAKIGLQTIKNVIDAMPDGEKKDKALQEFERTKATATMQQLEQLAQVDVKVNKQPDIVIQAPSHSQDKNNDVKR